VADTGTELGSPLKFLVGKPGLDGHSNGAEQIAVRARDAGFEVVYSGIRLTPAQIVASAVEEDVDVVGLSVLSGSHLSVVPDVLAGLRAAGLDDVPVVLGGIVPDADADRLKALGVARVFTPKDFQISDVLDQVVDAIREAHALS
jgi:(2R)-ethylmalonyl-CoA mutase